MVERPILYSQNYGHYDLIVPILSAKEHLMHIIPWLLAFIFPVFRTNEWNTELKTQNEILPQYPPASSVIVSLWFL